MTVPAIILIGAGNAAWHLGRRLHECGFSIRQVFSRNPEKAGHLAGLIGAVPIADLGQVDGGADLYLLAVRDDAIGEVAARLARRPGLSDRLVVHISGATPVAVLAPYFSRYGVFYPLQTFTTGKIVAFDQVPLCIDAARKEDLQMLQAIAEKISRKVYQIDDQQRAIIHVAAVFANNFSNHLYQVAAAILEEHQLPFDLLRPLIQETAAKVQEHNPNEVQTGPAARGDRSTIERHITLLQSQPAYRELYLELTRSINKDLKI